MDGDVAVAELSDESSFYGDDSDDEVGRLEDLVARYNPYEYWELIYPYSLNTIRRKALNVKKREEEEEKKKMTDTSVQEVEIYPPRGRIPSHTNDSVKAEDEDTNMMDISSECNAKRTSSQTATGLTPSNTPADAVGPWIYVSAPGQRLRQADTARLVTDGTRALHRFENDKAALQLQRDRAATGSKQAATRALLLRRQELERELFALARLTGVVSGKWMLFITADRVDEVWAVVAEATARGELGFGAKVATDDGQGRARLVAIYTHDHEDREDVARVLRQMVELGLVKREESPIYYKIDAFTHLEIMANNPWGLKASRFSSRDVLRDAR
ncbi:DUF1917 domain-containing protein [Aspergillus homomorphus CBS 101889]|uniref:DUF1917-domain-containing protein n=1 Tax=Aspergillus homomorphus (strain CBS 101889) TaxID=1450537 RepID=A0A395HTH9_ASPHC|nr:DUF1917-domain-containing protein [Aspergillus homomorphus CBS 101889]RAL10799.1 DUF1917-domain-containing protein [Aspergillus homomorphus CBS 101889]